MSAEEKGVGGDAEVWRCVTERGVMLSPHLRWSVRQAVANSVLEGWMPSAPQMDNHIHNLVAFTEGSISFEVYARRVLRCVGPGHECDLR